MISTLVYSFPLNFMFFYIQWTWIFIQIFLTCTSNVHNFSLNFQNLVHSSIFHWIFKILHIQWIRIFWQIRTISSSNVHNFPLNFHNLVLSTKSIFSTSPKYLCIQCTKFSWFSTFFDFLSNFHEILHSTNLNFFTNPNNLYF